MYIVILTLYFGCLKYTVFRFIVVDLIRIDDL